MNNLTIGQRLAQCIRADAKQRGLSLQEELNRLGVAESSFYHWEKGRADPSAYVLQAVANDGWGVSWILTGRDMTLKIKEQENPKTNADHIRAMSDVELAQLFCKADFCEVCGQLRPTGTCQAMEREGPLSQHCADAALRWLQQPVEGGGDNGTAD